jgi:hypothetical protein
MEHHAMKAYWGLVFSRSALDGVNWLHSPTALPPSEQHPASIEWEEARWARDPVWAL